MTRIARRFVPLALIGTLFATAPAHAQSKSRDLITREDIENSPQKDADIFAVIRSLRPNFLQTPKGVRSLTGTTSMHLGIYVDGTRESDFNSLKNILASTVDEVRYLDPSRAENEFGQESNGGAIIIKRTKGMRPAPRDTTNPPQR